VSLQELTSAWLGLPEKGFARSPTVNNRAIHCDCSGLVNLLCDHLAVPKPYALKQPRAVHYFAILQEIGSSNISQIKPWNLLAWRKENVPKSGDSGHVLLVVGEPIKVEENVYRLEVVDSTKFEKGLARREIRLHTNALGRVIGVQLHLSETKVKRSPIYHAPLLNNRYCLGCGIPHTLCLCHQVHVSRLEPSVIILRHPQERSKTLSTVSLIKLRYPQVLVREGEIFSPLRQKNLAVVFPDAEGEHVRPNSPTSTDNNRIAQTQQKTWILLDATWRKAKRMLHENTWLATLPRVSVAPEAVSDYLLRKVPNANALSTVEAFAMVQNDPALQSLFKVFMHKQIELMGKEKYASNYRDHINYTPL
jgi:DTW domain-containing protein YfiP